MAASMTSTEIHKLKGTRSGEYKQRLNNQLDDHDGQNRAGLTYNERVVHSLRIFPHNPVHRAYPSDAELPNPDTRMNAPSFAEGSSDHPAEEEAEDG
jgi:hypothetical protein